MITLTDYISSGMVVESIGSHKITDVFSDDRGHMHPYFRQYLSHELQWEKVTDSDIEPMSTEMARKLAYKKDSDAYVIWIDPQGKFIARSIGMYSILMDPRWYRMVNNTVKSVSMASDSAIVIPDSNKFSTSEIKRLRREQKEGALALKDDAQVAKENMKRYKDEIAKNQLSKINMGDVAESVKTVSEKYGELIKSIVSDAVVSDDFNVARSKFNEINDLMVKIMSDFRNIVSLQEKYKQYEKYEVLASDYRQRIISNIEHMNSTIDKFNEIYIDNSND